MAESVPINRNVVVKMVVKSQRNGVAAVIGDWSAIGAKEFTTPEFRQQPEGTILECHFSISSNGTFRKLVYCRKVEEGEKVATKVQDEDLGIKVELFPQWHEGHYFDEEMQYFFGLARNMLNAGEFVSAIMRGGSGYGKTSAFGSFAKGVSFNFLRVDCAAITDPEAWFGVHRASGGSTMFEPTEFAEAIQRGKTVILFDEANRIESWLANTLFPILDDSRSISIAGRRFDVKPPLFFAMTINEGIQFAGTFNMDAALRNRVDIALVSRPLPEEIEMKLIMDLYKLPAQTAKKIVVIVRNIRNVVERDKLFIDVSTRTLKKIARLVASGCSIDNAFKYVIINNVDSEDAKPIVDVLKVY